MKKTMKNDMRKTFIPLLAILLCWVFVPASNAQNKEPGMEKVCMYNQVTKQIKPGCTQIIGKHDNEPIYKCFDTKKEKEIDFDPGTDWKPFPATRVCMLNQITDVVQTDCVECQIYDKADEQANENNNIKYFCFDKKTGKPFELDMQSDNKWKPLSLDDPLVKGKTPSSNDVIKGAKPDRDFFKPDTDHEESTKQEQKQ
jgi:hypothetical protein